MAPASIGPNIVDVVEPRKDTLALPATARERLEKGGVDLSNGYPYHPSRPLYLDDVYRIRDYDREYIDPGTRADPEKKALLSAAKEVVHLTKHIGTEILGLLIAERSVVFFRDQDISPQEQKKLGEWYGKIEVHPQAAQVPGIPGVSVMLPVLQASEIPASFRRPGGAAGWHTDLVHERQPAGVTHLHNDTIPSVGGDTLWASGYAAYEKLSPAFRKIIDGRTAMYRSAHPYLDRDNPEAGPKYKALWVNRAMTVRIVGLDKAESDLILGFKWSPRSSVLWDNRWDYEGSEPRHGTRITALAEKPFFDPKARSRREALGLLGKDEIEELERLKLEQQS
ncbi:hypothetical protein BDW71DRAFT_197650 [Aspergillus fruticulosus]